MPETFNPFNNPKAIERAIDLLKESLRNSLAKAVRAAKNYDGTERAYDDLFNLLINFESQLESCRSTDSKTTEEFEQEVLKHLNVKHKNLTINGLLEIANAKFRTKICQLPEDSNEDLKEDLPENIYKIHLNGVILKPGSDLELQTTKKGHSKLEHKNRARLQSLIALLNRNKIFTDDLVVYTGTTNPEMKRKLSYEIVEIPRLNKSVLVCDEIGEATFVIHSNIDAESFLSLSKDELLKKYPDTTRITETDPVNWEEKLFEAIFRAPNGLIIQPGRKIDIATRESMRSLIKNQYNAEEFLNLNSPERRNLKIAGRKYSAIAGLFGMPSGGIGKYALHIQLAAAIYGSNDPIVQNQLLSISENENIQRSLGEDPKLWAEQIKTSFPDPNFFINLSHEERKKFNIHGQSLQSLAKIFAIQGEPRDSNTSLYELLQKIYGTDDEELNKAIEAQRKKEQSVEAAQISPEELKQAIKKEYPNCEDFVRTAEKQKRTFSSAGVSLYVIGRKFGIIKNRPDDTFIGLYDLAQEIYGSDDSWILAHKPAYLAKLKQIQFKELTKEDCRAMVIAEYPTAENFLGLLAITANERKKIKINGLGLTAIASRLGLTTNPLFSTKYFLFFAQEIYGSDNPNINEKLNIILKREALENDLTQNPEKLITLIQERYPTKSEFNKLNKNRAERCKIAGFGILAIAKILQIPSRRTVDKTVINDIADKVYSYIPDQASV